MLVSHCEIPVYAMYKFDCISTKKNNNNQSWSIFIYDLPYASL